VGQLVRAAEAFERLLEPSFGQREAGRLEPGAGLRVVAVLDLRRDGMGPDHHDRQDQQARQRAIQYARSYEPRVGQDRAPRSSAAFAGGVSKPDPRAQAIAGAGGRASARAPAAPGHAAFFAPSWLTERILARPDAERCQSRGRPGVVRPMGPIRILHTADWHLGHTLAGHGRQAEHAAFLTWLVEAAEGRDVDAVVVAGDVFDGRMPSGAAQRLYFGFLAELHRRAPSVPVVVIAGNHDSPSRLSAAGPVLGMLGVHVFGAAGPGEPPRQLALRLDTRRGPLAVAAVPHVRPSDLSGVGDGLDPERNRAALTRLFHDVADEARRLAPGAPLLAVGHAHVRGAVLSPRSERALAGFGPAAREAIEGAGAVEASTFPADAAYVALGHLHLSQDVGAASPRRIRYAGSPIPLALAEAGYRHAVSVVELEPGGAVVEEVPVPRMVAIERLVAPSASGDEGPLEAAEVLAKIAALPAAAEVPPERHAWLEIRVRPGPRRVAALRAELEAALEDRAARLVRLTIDVQDAAAPARPPLPELGELPLREVIRRRYEDVRRAPMSPAHEQALEAVIARALDRVGRERAQAEDASPSGSLS
jgi:exonuclease SbcD